MNSLQKDLRTALFLGLILPGILLNTADLFLRIRSRTVQEETIPETVAETACPPVRLREYGAAVSEMEMDTYLTRVLLAEVPADFEMEALKAQAVAARTYTRKARETGGKHGDGSVCTEAACCQAYLPEEAYLARGGTQAGIDRIRDAVSATSGQVLIYDGNLIEATYFSCSGGHTEDAAAVWGSEFPYLQAVESPGEENAVHFTDTATFTHRQFQNALGIILPEDTETWIGAVSYTAGGGVADMEIGGEVFSGTRLRSLLGLRSTNFTVTVGENITITTKGYGHRVGMSQYGADAMAVAGSSYEEILRHYYQGAVLTKLEN